MNELIEKGIIHMHFGDEAGMGIVIAAVAVTALAGYLLGSLNFAIIISRLMHREDIRSHGSGNPGMSNMLRTYGKKAAALTLAGDFAKTVIAVFVGTLLLGRVVNYVTSDGLAAVSGLPGDYIGGAAAVIGHAFPVFYRFKGGKSVACMLGLVLFTHPLVALLLLIIFVGLVWATRYISLGSVVAVMAYPIVLDRNSPNPDMHILIAFGVAALVVWLHRGNIKRILSGTESKISFGKKKDEPEQP